MGLLDQLFGGAASSTPAADPSLGQHQGLLEHVMGMIGNSQTGGLGGILSKLKAGGLGGAVGSWVGNGPNQAVSPDQVSAAMGESEIAQMAQKFGLAPSAVAGHLSQILPQLINHLTPNGSVPEQGGVAAAIALLRGKLLGH